MLKNENALRLIAMYMKINNLYDSHLKYSCERFSNNNEPDFTDAEIMTIYIYVMNVRKCFQNKSIYEYADEHLRSWFPQLPSYVAFNNRLNRLAECFKVLVSIILTYYKPDDCDNETSLLDSMPIITCSGKRNAKVAREIANKSYCSTKNLWYYGLKLHALAFRRKGTLPFPEAIVITEASENDLNVFKQNWHTIINRQFFGDKIYSDEPFFTDLEQNMNSKMFTPVKMKKGTPEILIKRDKAAFDLLSKAVSSVRQPIESLFNWIIEKTDIQRASKVRSTKGLIVHVFGRIAAAFFKFAF